MRIFLLGTAVFALAGMALAQSQIGGATLNGEITDPSGAVVIGAKITATQTATNVTRTTESNGEGAYTLTPLTSGVYDVTVEAPGFKTAKLANINLTAGALATLDVSLQVGTAVEVITVVESAPLIETGRSQISTTVDSRSIAELPINGRNFLDFAVLTPGVVKDPSRGGDLAFGGQRGTMNSLQVDGTDANNIFFGQSTGRSGTRNPYSFSQDAVKEFQVSSNGASAEVGRAGAGIINVVTKSGTNAFHGTVFEFFRDRGLNANSWTNNRIRARKNNYHYNQFGGNVGGPIVKDKAFFFFDYDGQRNNDPITMFLGGPAAPADADSQRALATLRPFVTQYARKLDNNAYLGKVDLNISPSQQISVRYNANRFNGVNYENAFVQNAEEHTGDSNVATDNFSGNHTWVLSPSMVLESRLTYTRDDEPGQANTDKPEAIIRQGGSTVISIGRNTFSPRYTNIKTYQWAEGLSVVRGNHTLKFGLDMIWQRIDNFFPGNFSGSFTFNSYGDFARNTPLSFTQAFAGPNTDGPLTKPNIAEYAFYAQDSWRATNKLTLNYGVRYDLFVPDQPKIKHPDAALAAAGLDTSRINRDKNNFAPRVGFAYKVFDKDTTVIRGAYGMYYARTPAIMTGTAFSQNGIQVQTYTLTTNIPTYPNVLTAPPTLNRTPDIYVFAPDYVQPLTHQWSMSIDHALGNDYLISIGYQGLRGIHLSRTRDINLQPAVPFDATLSTGGTATLFRHPGRVNPAFGRISLFDSGADSIYHGGFIQLTKRLSQRFQVQTSYTYSKVMDSKPDFTSVVVGADDSKNAEDTLKPNAERARGNSDVTHKFTFSGIWDITYANNLSNPVLRHLLRGFELSMTADLRSGRPLTPTISGDPNGDGNSATDRPPFFGRNSLTGPNYLNTDMRLTRDIPLGSERVNLRLIFEAFNATNRVNFTGLVVAPYSYNATTRVLTPSATFGTKTTGTTDPRILQLAGKITF